MEDILKRRHVVLPDSEDKDAEISSKQGRNLQEEGLDEMVRNMMKDKSEVFKTPTQSKTSGRKIISLQPWKQLKPTVKGCFSEVKAKGKEAPIIVRRDTSSQKNYKQIQQRRSKSCRSHTITILREEEKLPTSVPLETLSKSKWKEEE
ncbi:hypothetical protein Tco_0849346 [Tanacetum coccineum]